MYPQGQVPGQTFSPAGSVEGSPLHQPHPGAPYTQPMHMPPGQPGPGPQGFMYGAEMPPYGAPPGGFQPPGPGFQAPGNNQPPPGQPGQPGPAPGQQGGPPAQQPPPPGTQPPQQFPPGHPPPHTMPEYNSFNMQGM